MRWLIEKFALQHWVMGGKTRVAYFYHRTFLRLISRIVIQNWSSFLISGWRTFLLWPRSSYEASSHEINTSSCCKLWSVSKNGCICTFLIVIFECTNNLKPAIRTLYAWRNRIGLLLKRSKHSIVQNTLIFYSASHQQIRKNTHKSCRSVCVRILWEIKTLT